MLVAIIITIIAIVIIILIVAISSYRHERGDYKDGGGTQIGGNQRIPLFTPANERAGMHGEKVVNYHLRPLLREDEYLLANLLLPLRNGHKTEIDCVLISRKGIFCIETKNWVGHIDGNDDDEYWHQEYDDPYMSDKDHKNPVRQNEGHCRVLEKILHNRYGVHNVVIFANLEDGRGIYSEYAFTVSEFKKHYRGLFDHVLSIEEVKVIYQLLCQYLATPEELEQHRREVKERYNHFN